MQDHSVLLVLLVLVVTMGQLEDPGHRELLDLRDHKDLRVRMVHKDLVEQLVHRVIPEPAGQTETQERRVSQVLRDLPDLKDPQELLGLMARQEIAVLMETLAHKGHKGPKGLLAQSVLRAQPGLLVPLECRVIPVTQAFRVLRE